tara:strand:- start:241 stop:1347 length:1107 start_codon:yes stop_codon:yes gene_type:complete
MATKTLDPSDLAGYIFAGLSIVIVLGVLVWMFVRMQSESTDCLAMETLYGEQALVSSVDTSAPSFSNNLRDYYVLTAYNACSPGGFTNAFVSTCALSTIIGQGARCLDFEVYSIDGEPAISTSAEDSYNVKQTFNSVPFDAAMSMISDMAFSSSTCPCAKDPLFIHLRIMSDDKSIYGDIANSIEKNLSNRLLPPQFGYENNGMNLGATPLCQLSGKAVIMVDKQANPLFASTPLDELVNIASGSVFMRELRFTKDIKNGINPEALIDFNKKNMSIVLPDLSSSPKNGSFNHAKAHGCQFIAMCMQNFDANMEQCSRFFDRNGSSIVLKPKHLRFDPPTFKAPACPNPKYSYKARPLKLPGTSKTASI